MALLRERARRGQLDLVQQALGRVRGQRPLRAERRGGLLRALDLRLRVLPRPVELRPQLEIAPVHELQLVFQDFRALLELEHELLARVVPARERPRPQFRRVQVLLGPAQLVRDLRLRADLVLQVDHQLLDVVRERRDLLAGELRLGLGPLALVLLGLAPRQQLRRLVLQRADVVARGERAAQFRAERRLLVLRVAQLPAQLRDLPLEALDGRRDGLVALGRRF